MNYLYGDSTTSTLKSNFLEFLRDAIDFCVFVLQADAKMKEGRVKIRALSEEADAEIGRLERFISSVVRAVDTGEKGKDDSPTAACAARLVTLIGDAQKASITAIRSELSQAIARIEAEEAAGRDACVHALGTLLAPHEPPDAKSITRVVLANAVQYEGRVEAKAEPALDWTLDLAIPDASDWNAPVRIEQIVPHLEIRAPQLAGWISKEVKVRPQKIERHAITQFVDKDGIVKLEVRTEPDSGVGFDFQVNAEKKSVVKAARIGPAEDQSVGPFELPAEDAALVVDLVAKLRSIVGSFVRTPSIVATFDGADFRTLPTFVDFVHRLVEMMAPIVKEISQRSLTTNELVLRRPLGNDRREEIFVAKSTLREKLAVLPSEARAFFAPLGLDAATATTKAVAPAVDPPAIRSELPPSVPPPPVAVKPPVAKAPAAPASSPGARSPKPPPAAPVSQKGGMIATPAATPAAKARPASSADADAPSLEIVEEVEMNSDALLASVPPQSSPTLPKSDARNDVLIAALKKIVKLSRNGRANEAYQEYVKLFSGSTFADYRPEDQRQALKLMVLAKTHPADKDAVVAAHKAALSRIKALLEGGSLDAADHELLGVTQQYLGDAQAARSAFEAGLELERAKNPQSELVANLTRRVSQL